jgi:hypothetical protein
MSTTHETFEGAAGHLVADWSREIHARINWRLLGVVVTMILSGECAWHCSDINGRPGEYVVSPTEIQVMGGATPVPVRNLAPATGDFEVRPGVHLFYSH